MSHPTLSALADRPENPIVGLEMPHEAASLHVTGEALYTDDLVDRLPGTLTAWPLQAPYAHAKITKLDVSPAYGVPGVVKVLTAADVPGVNDAGIKHDEPLFPDEVMFYGHAVCWVLGETQEAARFGAEAIVVEYEPLPVADHPGRGDRGRELPGPSAGGLPRRRRRGAQDRGAPVLRHLRVRRPGALLPGDQLRAGPHRRGRPDLHPVQHPAPVGDPGDRRPRARSGQPPHHGAVPADGRRLRRQGDAAARFRRHRRAGRDAHRPSGAAAAEPHPGHHHDRQAAPVSTRPGRPASTTTASWSRCGPP